VRLGRLNKRITIRRKSAPTRNAMNEPVVIWADFASFWAQPIEQKNSEARLADQVAEQSVRVWRVRWNARTATISPLDRLICDGREFEVTSAIEIDRHAAIEISGIAFSELGSNGAAPDEG